MAGLKWNSGRASKMSSRYRPDDLSPIPGKDRSSDLHIHTIIFTHTMTGVHASRHMQVHTDRQTHTQ